MFSLDERVDFLRQALASLENVEVEVFSEWFVDFAHRWNAKAIVKACGSSPTSSGSSR